MSKILIVGGGQAGLQLALSLLHHDYDVTLMTARTAEELYYGRAVSVQIMHDNRLHAERELGLNLWDDTAPPIKGFTLRSGGGPGIPSFDWTGSFAAPAQSIDERLKMSVWMSHFEEKGGKLIIHAVTSDDLDGLVPMFDLTIVAAGHSGLAQMFPVDPDRSPTDTGEIPTAIAYVDDVIEGPDRENIVAEFLPGGSHFVSVPSYSANGPCRLLYLHGGVSGALDWPRRITPEEHWDRMLGLLRDEVPHVYETYAEAGLADEKAATFDHATPLVRRPVAELPSGGRVLGMGDTLITVSTALQQEADNASVSADRYLEAILDNGDRPFDEDFMQKAFESYYDHARHFCGDLGRVLHHAAPFALDAYLKGDTHQAVADRIVRGFEDPADFASWLSTEETARAYLDGV
ncbi:styrene monooxygenase/indole monooxygenase family protein [Nocardiopsis mangrovi]|uniref:Styrene monooxygenase/indole monooxygenase family protein n=1 Tax=Nocardiopsis mangrovi TaxID=1179818 RepID=A0ABV9DY49_9ACTN